MKSTILQVLGTTLWRKIQGRTRTWPNIHKQPIQYRWNYRMHWLTCLNVASYRGKVCQIQATVHWKVTGIDHFPRLITFTANIYRNSGHKTNHRLFTETLNGDQNKKQSVSICHLSLTLTTWPGKRSWMKIIFKFRTIYYFKRNKYKY